MRILTATGTPQTPSAAPEEPLPPAAPTLVNDALCDEFALPPLVVTQRPPVENQALPELSPWVHPDPRRGWRGNRDTRDLWQTCLGLTGQNLDLQSQLHPQQGGNILGNRP